MVRGITGEVGNCVSTGPTSVPFTRTRAAFNIGGGDTYSIQEISMDLSLSVPTANENRPVSISFLYLIAY